MKFKILLLVLFSLLIKYCSSEPHYNIPDPECNGSFGICTQLDKDLLGHKAIAKLHESMDDDHDGQVELKETKDFMKEELQYKNGFDRQQKLHGSDAHITVEELWTSWKLSQAHNWTVDDLVVWLNDYVKLPQYVESIRRNQIDGQFLPRIAVNDNNYLQNILQIKDVRHKNRLMLKATDIVLFGLPTQSNSNLLKDFIMISALTLAVVACVYSLNKNRRSQEQIKHMIKEFERISYASNVDDSSSRQNEHDTTQIVSFKVSQELKRLLAKTHDYERDLLEFKFKCIEREKEECSQALEKMFKQQSGLFGAFKIAHTSDLDNINSKLELMKTEIKKCNDEKREWKERWSQISQIIVDSEKVANNNITNVAQEPLKQSVSAQSFPILIDKQKSLDLDLLPQTTNESHIKKVQSEQILTKEINNNDDTISEDRHLEDENNSFNNSLNSTSKFRKTMNLVKLKKLFRKSISKKSQ